MKVLDLFSGIGGFSLGLENAGMETVAFCEIEPFCQKVLAKHWPDVPIYSDIKTLTAERLKADGITADLVCGGYPCQPFSHAGKRGGEKDDRHLWPEMYRLIETVRPRWVIAENVAGHISMGLDDVLSDLEAANYAWWTFVIPACAVDARHRRDRAWIVADSGCRNGTNGRARNWSDEKQKEESGKRGTQIKNGNVTDLGTTNNQRPECAWRGWVSESGLDRVAHGVPNRVDRLKSLGNAVVPQVVEAIGRAIMDANFTPKR